MELSDSGWYIIWYECEWCKATFVCTIPFRRGMHLGTARRPSAFQLFSTSLNLFWRDCFTFQDKLRRRAFPVNLDLKIWNLEKVLRKFCLANSQKHLQGKFEAISYWNHLITLKIETKSSDYVLTSSLLEYPINLPCFCSLSCMCMEKFRGKQSIHCIMPSLILLPQKYGFKLPITELARLQRLRTDPFKNRWQKLAIKWRIVVLGEIERE